MRAHVQARKVGLRVRRKKRIRGKAEGRVDHPRVSIFRSNKYFYAQAIDDINGTTIVGIDGSKLGLGNNRADVAKLAVQFAEMLKAKKIENIVFDRNGYLYHGVVASFADALREAGIKF